MTAPHHRGITKFNYKSDFDFILRLLDAEGNDIGFPDCDFSVRVWTVSKSNAYIASSIGGEAVNLYNDDGQIHIVCDNHGLAPGKLKAEVSVDLPQSVYPDASHRVVDVSPLCIDLVRTGPFDVVAIEPQVVSMPLLMRTAYDLAVMGGYTGTLEEYCRLLSDITGVPAHLESLRASIGAARAEHYTRREIDDMLADISGSLSELTSDEIEAIAAGVFVPESPSEPDEPDIPEGFEAFTDDEIDSIASEIFND